MPYTHAMWRKFDTENSTVTSTNMTKQENDRNDIR